MKIRRYNIKHSDCGKCPSVLWIQQNHAAQMHKCVFCFAAHVLPCSELPLPTFPYEIPFPIYVFSIVYK